MAKGTRERGIDRAINILDYLHKHRRPMVINELASAMGAPRSTIYELTKVLLDRSILDSYSGGRVYLGRKLLLYGAAVPEQYSLIELSKPLIDELAEKLGERVELNGIVDWKQSVLTVADGKRSYFFPLQLGASYPLPLTASGRFLIDGIDEASLRARIPEEDYFLHGKKVMTLERFLEDSRNANSRGYSVTSGLLDTYLSAMAMPIVDLDGRVLATIGMAFPSGALPDNESRFARALGEARAKIQERLLGPG